jgi:hypothetical protein
MQPSDDYHSVMADKKQTKPAALARAELNFESVPWTPIQRDLMDLETLVVQLEVAKSLLQSRSAPHARIAFILLDNAAEVMMVRNIEATLFFNSINERILERLRELLDHANSTELHAMYTELKDKVIPKEERKKLERYFDEKVKFLTSQKILDPAEGSVLTKLHKYRNEMYHRDRLRPETVFTASLLYFELCCSIFERGDGHIIGYTLATSNPLPPAIARYNPSSQSSKADLTPSLSRIADSLRLGLHLDEAGLREKLKTHLKSRLHTIAIQIAKIGQHLGVGEDIVVRLAYLHEELPPGDFDSLMVAKVPHSTRDLKKWLQEVEKLDDRDDKLSMFRIFSEIEDEFEPLEILVRDLAARVDYEIERGELGS